MVSISRIGDVNNVFNVTVSAQLRKFALFNILWLAFYE